MYVCIYIGGISIIYIMYIYYMYINIYTAHAEVREGRALACGPAQRSLTEPLCC